MRTLLKAVLLLTLVSTTARAQITGAVWDSSQLPETRGTIRQYTLTPRGDVDGLILTDGTEVKLPPHLTGQIVFAVRPGDGSQQCSLPTSTRAGAVGRGERIRPRLAHKRDHDFERLIP